MSPSLNLNPTTWTRKRFLLATLGLSLALRLFRIGNQSLWVDEILTFVASNPKPGLTIWDYLKYNTHGPVHSFVVWLIKFVSVNDAWLRAPSAVAGTIAVYYFFRWIEVWLGERLARGAVLLLALHPLHIFYSQEMRNYSFLLCFVFAASYYFHGRVQGGQETPRRLAAYVLPLIGAAMSNLSSVFLYTIHSVLFLFRRGKLGRRLIVWGGLSLFLLLCLSPWVYRAYRSLDVPRLVTPVKPGEIPVDERLRGETTVTPVVIPYTAFVFSTGFTLGPTLRELHGEASVGAVMARHGGVVVWVATLFGTLGTLGFVRLMRRRAPVGPLVLYMIMPIGLTVLLCWQNAKVYNVRYVLIGLPAFICFIAAGIDSLGRWRMVGSVLVGVTMLVSLYNHYFDGRYARADLRGAARHVAARERPGECILAPTVTEVFTHYYRGEAPVFSISAPSGTTTDRVDAQLDRVLANCDRLWYVRAREWVDDADGYTLQALRAHYHQTELVEMDGVKVFRFVRDAWR